MSFDTPHGTRGARQPGGKLMAWMNTWNMNRIRGNADKVMGMQALVLTTVGAKSGTPRHTPVAYFPDGADSWLIVASANGAAKNPAWYYNLASHPDSVQIQIAGRTIAVNAEQCTATPASKRGTTSPAPQSVSRSTSRKPTVKCRSSACAPDPSRKVDGCRHTAREGLDRRQAVLAVRPPLICLSRNRCSDLRSSSLVSCGSMTPSM